MNWPRRPSATGAGRTAEARVLIDEELDAYREAMATRSVAGAIRAIGAKYQDSLGANLDRLLQGDLAGLSEAEREALREWTAVMAKRLSHLPVVGLRAVAIEIGQDGVDAFLAAAAPELLEQRRANRRSEPSTPLDGRRVNTLPTTAAGPAAAPAAGTAPPAEPLLLRALRFEETPRRPLWMMRQAGRILPEYRALKERHGFAGLARDPELAAEVTLMPLRRFPFDAAITFADIMSPMPALGVDFRFDPGPVIAEPIRSARDVAALPDPDDLDEAAIAPEVASAQRIVRSELVPETALLGFAGAPLTPRGLPGRGSRRRATSRGCGRSPTRSRRLSTPCSTDWAGSAPATSSASTGPAPTRSRSSTPGPASSRAPNGV